MKNLQPGKMFGVYVGETLSDATRAPLRFMNLLGKEELGGEFDVKVNMVESFGIFRLGIKVCLLCRDIILETFEFLLLY